MPRRHRKAKMVVPFSKKLALNQWLLGLLGVKSFEDLARHLRDEQMEGLDDDNVHRFHHALCLHLPPDRRRELPDDALLRHDQAIVSVTRRLNQPRLSQGLRPIRWKYFQYLALLFSDIYLTRYFEDPAALLASVNRAIDQYNAGTHGADRLPRLDPGTDPRSTLNKLAFWMATGSGKTLLMHAHILRFLNLHKKHGREGDLNRIILLTPNEGLSRQHHHELAAAGIPARIFSRKAAPSLWLASSTVEILDVHKLADDMGDKTVAVSAFEGRNLVLVDEGHRGATSGSKGKWMRHRDQLCENGFSFEYSATFGQAIKGNRELTNDYARTTLFDYSYRWFHGDGFGKDYRIFNLEEHDQEWRARYLTGALLSFFQQQWVYERNEAAVRPYNVERPLWMFVGSKVVKYLAAQDASDIVEILRFLSNYVLRRSSSIARIRDLLDQDAGVGGPRRRLHGDFKPLADAGLGPEEVFRHTLATTFNAPAGGRLHVEPLKAATGELALRIGDNPPFGVVNVGDPGKLAKLCEKHGLPVRDSEFASSLFREVNDAQSAVHLVVGAKKFTEGWNSWRVSSMGLMNVGKSEGSQIIQLFGRGVRLKGLGMSLKRSSALKAHQAVAPPELGLLETLMVFGVRAKYMSQFRKFLKEEGLSVDPADEHFVPIRKRKLPSEPLKTIRLAATVAGDDPASAFRRSGPLAILRTPGDPNLSGPVRQGLAHSRITLNWYPRIKALQSQGFNDGQVSETELNEAHLAVEHLALLDMNALYLALLRFKADRGWRNLAISPATIRDLLQLPTRGESWYRLQIPEADMRFDDTTKVRWWQEIALALLKKYVTRYYGVCRQAWEATHLEYQDLTLSDPNFPTVTRETGVEHGYRVQIDSKAAPNQRDQMLRDLEELTPAAASDKLPRPSANRIVNAVRLDQHLYSPLLRANEYYMVSPPALNDGENRFVKDFRAYCRENRPSGVRYYVLRNQSRGRGVGFFEANNFYPDFILWAVVGRRQHIAFIDPKGLVHIGPGDPKVRLHQTIKDIESRLGDPLVRLHSFILSVTDSSSITSLWGMTKADLAARNIFFMKEDRQSYVGELLRRMGVLQVDPRS